MKLNEVSVVATSVPQISMLLKFHSSIFIPKKLVANVSGSMKAEKIVKYLMVILVSSSKILFIVSSIESIFSSII